MTLELQFVNKRILDVIHVDVNFTLKTALFGERPHTCYKPINTILILYTRWKKEKNSKQNGIIFVLHLNINLKSLLHIKISTLENSIKPGAFRKLSLNNIKKLHLKFMSKNVISNYLHCISIRNTLYTELLVFELIYIIHARTMQYEYENKIN